MSSHLFRHRADSARAQVRPEQQTLISVFKLNSFKPCQFKYLRARRRELARDRVGYRLNFIDSDSAYRFRFFSIPSFDSNVIK